jgi:hypothetical protein
MTVAATSDTHHDPRARPDLIKVKSAHVQLMRAYVAALADASRYQRSNERTDRKGCKFAFGPMVRWLVGSHIRRNLMELGTVYLQLEQTFTRDDSDPVDRWLSKAREGCASVAERLPRPLRFPGVIAAISGVVALSGLLSKIPGWLGSLFLGLAIGAAISLYAPYLFMRDSYQYKRELFLRNARSVDKEPVEKQKTVRDDNIYALEDELFNALHRGKTKEAEVDKWLRFFVVNLLTYCLIGLSIWVNAWNFYLSFALLIAGLIVYFPLFRRIWRNRRSWL